MDGSEGKSEEFDFFKIREDARKSFRAKEYSEAYQKYSKMFRNENHIATITSDYEIYNKEKYQYINTMITSINYLYLDSKDNKYFREFCKYLKKYISVAKEAGESETKTWAINIFESLIKNIIEVGLIKYSDEKTSFSILSSDIKKYLNETVLSLIDVVVLPGVREKVQLYDFVLMKAFAERVNFERAGRQNQNVFNTKVLCQFFLNNTEDEVVFKRRRSNIYLLMSELVYNDPEELGATEFEQDTLSLDYIKNSISEYGDNKFAQSRKNVLYNYMVNSSQMSKFIHDINSELSTLKYLSRELINNNCKDDLSNESEIVRIVNQMDQTFKMTSGKSPRLSSVDVVRVINNIVNNAYQDVKLEVIGSAVVWDELNEGYFYNVLDNILKNSFEAYERNGIERPKPAVLIVVDCNDLSIKVQDWAGGVPEEFLRNDKLFDLYISSKGVAQRKGLGLSSVKKACGQMLLSIEYTVDIENKSTIVLIKREDEEEDF